VPRARRLLRIRVRARVRASGRARARVRGKVRVRLVRGAAAEAAEGELGGGGEQGRLVAEVLEYREERQAHRDLRVLAPVQQRRRTRRHL